MLVTKPELNAFIIAYEFIKRTGGDTSLWCDLKALSQEMGIEVRDFELGIDFLMRKKLITGYGAGYTYFISDYGVDQVTCCIKYPDKPSNCFPPLLDIQAIVKANGGNLLI
jgi:hypothetical protein